MWVRVRMIGTGVTGDPFRAPWPLYRTLIRDDETPFGVQNPRQCVIDIPDDVIPPAEGAEVAPVTINVAGIGQVVRQFDPAHRARIIAAIKRRWRERGDTYDVQDG